jgi:hypothetical protein
MGDMLGEFFLASDVCLLNQVTHIPSISPGRFFAANEVKALLAHILVTYDVRLEEGKRAPRTFIIDLMHVPEKANVMFRKRQK